MKWLGKFVFHYILVDQFTVHNNWTLFTGGLTSFTMLNRSKFIQNVVKCIMN
jgi:hypothetical protein